MSAAPRVAVAGATGYVGGALVPRLAAEGSDVVALARRPEQVPVAERVRAVGADVGDEHGLAVALEGVEAAYYLVHSMAGGKAFAAEDRRLAASFGRAAARAGVRRIVYLGALGDDPGSDHLASRQEVGALLGTAGVPVVELRAAVVLGSGSTSFEMLRYLTERLPAMVCPRWVRTRIQPIAEADLIEYLVRSLAVAPGVYEIGGADVTTYREMIEVYARVRGLRRRVIVDVPYLTPRLTSYWVDLVTPVNRSVTHALVESLVTEVVVTDAARTDAAFDFRPRGLEPAVRAALGDQEAAIDAGLFDLEPGLLDGVYVQRSLVPVEAATVGGLDAELGEAGGSLAWYGAPLAWRARMLAGRLMGERFTLGRPAALVAGAEVDWWTVTAREPGVLVLRSREWAAGEAWLGYRIAAGGLVQVGALRPRGVPGFLYWKLLGPAHRWVFARMASHRAGRVDAGAPRRRRAA